MCPPFVSDADVALYPAPRGFTVHAPSRTYRSRAHICAVLLAYLAAQTAQLLNSSRAAEVFGVDRRTVQSHIRLLEDLFLVVRLPASGKPSAPE